LSVDKTAEAILALPDKGQFVHREMIWQADWTDTDIATYAELKAMAKFWLMRKDIISDIESLDYDQEHQVARDLVEKIRGIGG
jgi:hypothetical protein